MEVRHKGRVYDPLPLAFYCLCASRSSLTLLVLRRPFDRFRRLKRVLHMIDTESDANAELDFLELRGGPAHTTLMNSWAASKQKKN